MVVKELQTTIMHIMSGGKETSKNSNSEQSGQILVITSVTINQSIKVMRSLLRKCTLYGCTVYNNKIMHTII